MIVALPAMASGYGPAPFYRPNVGAPASQRGQSEQTIANERNVQEGNSNAVGGVANGHTESGRLSRSHDERSIYAGH